MTKIITSFLLVFLGVIISGFGFFAWDQYQQLKLENQSLKENMTGELMDQKELGSEMLGVESESEVSEELTEDITEVQVSEDSGLGFEEAQKEPEVVTEVVYVDRNTGPTAEERQREIDAAVQAALAEQSQVEEAEEALNPEVLDSLPVEVEEEIVIPAEAYSIQVSSVRQTAYPDGYGGTYGSYEIEMTIFSNELEILVPQTTSDSLGTGRIGFSYTVPNDFSGTQDSVVNCSLKTNIGNVNYCKIKPDGRVRTVTTTVFLTPDSEGGGNYALTFDKMLYYVGSEEKSFDINRTTSVINIQW